MTRILFIKTSSLGDLVHHCPAVSDAARALPGAQIDWVVEEAFAAIPRMHGAVRRTIGVGLRRWRRSLWRASTWGEILRFRARLAEERYDAVIDTQGLLKSALICAGARGTRHGFDRASAREPIATRFSEVAHAVPRGLHAVERNRRLAAAALDYPIPGELRYGLRAPAHSKPGSYVVLLTMTSRADKLWPEERWITLACKLGTAMILPWGSAEERQRAERIAREIGAGAEVAQRMPIDELAGLLAGAAAVVGLDSGLTHLAGALGVPTVGIYCGSDPALTGLYGLPRAKNVGAAGIPPEVSDVLAALQ